MQLFVNCLDRAYDIKPEDTSFEDEDQLNGIVWKIFDSVSDRLHSEGQSDTNNVNFSGEARKQQRSDHTKLQRFLQ